MTNITAAERKVLLRTLVGSQAHGLARPDSDFDYREVFIIPTSEMLSLGRPLMKFGWMTESRHADDEGGHEIAQFLHLCSKGAPNAVEMLFAPLASDWVADGTITDAIHQHTGSETQRAGRLVLAHKPVMEGIVGYAMNSFRKIESNPGKWQAGMLRVLYQGRELLSTGTMSLDVRGKPYEFYVRKAAAGELSAGQALDIANDIVGMIHAITPGTGLPEEPRWAEANEWLLALRRENW